jgi:streptogramin lyase
MTQIRGKNSAWTFSLWGSRPSAAVGGRRVRRPSVERLESRSLLSTITEFPAPTAASRPISIVAGSDGNLWFTEFLANKIGTINPTTHATVDFAVPTAAANPYWIAAGPDGNLWFTEPNGNKVGTINPTTHVITEFPLPTAGSAPQTITAGPDGNLWFTEEGTNKIATINPTSHVITEFAVPTAGAFVFGIVTGPDGNLWFTETIGNKIGTIDPTTHTVTEFPIPTAASSSFGIAAGSDGNLWFVEFNGNKVASINPSTHAFTETPLTTPGSSPFGIAAGPDGNLWFTESSAAGNRVGAINPTTRGIVETPSPTAVSTPFGIAPGPDGNLWFTEADAAKVAVLAPTLNLFVTAQPPTFVSPGGAFGLTVSAFYQSGVLDTAFNGNVTLALAINPGNATLGGTLIAPAHNGVATFTGLTLDKLGKGYRLIAFTDPLTTTLTSAITVAQPPTILTEKVIVAGVKRKRHVAGFELDFSKALDPARAMNVANYTLTQNVKVRRKLVTQPVSFTVAYDATAHSVTLTLTSKATFGAGGKLVVSAQAPNGITDAGGEFLDGGNTGKPGNDAVFTIAPKGSGISR